MLKEDIFIVRCLTNAKLTQDTLHHRRCPLRINGVVFCRAPTESYVRDQEGWESLDTSRYDSKQLNR